MRLYGLGFVDTVFLGMRPWTRLSVAHMLDLSADRITGSTSDEAIEIYSAIERGVDPDLRIPLDQRFGRASLDSVYERIMGIAGTPCAIASISVRPTSMILAALMPVASTATAG